MGLARNKSKPFRMVSGQQWSGGLGADFIPGPGVVGYKTTMGGGGSGGSKRRAKVCRMATDREIRKSIPKFMKNRCCAKFWRPIPIEKVKLPF